MHRRDFGVIIPEGTPSRPSFSIRWWEGGKWRRKRGFPTKTAAGAKLALIRTSLASGLLEADRRAEIALSTAAEEWLKHHSAVKLRSHDGNVQRWARLEEILGKTLALKDVTHLRILEVRKRLAELLPAPATVNRHLALLRTVLNHAVTAGYLQASPVRRFARGSYLLPEPRVKRAPPLESNAEGGRLLRALRDGAPEYFALFAFLLGTGARRGEGAGLKWEDVDLARRVVTIRRSYDQPPKSGKEGTVPITAELAAILAKHRTCGRWPGPMVFPNPRTGQMLSPDVKLGKLLDDACKVAGVPRMRVHDLRHAAASLFLMGGGSLHDAQRNLRHSTPQITSEIYGHIAESHRVSEAERHLTFGIDDEGPAVEKLRTIP